MGNSVTHAALLQGIIEASDAAVIAEDLDGRITLWSGSAERMFGYAAAEAIGKPIASMVPAEKSEETQQARRDALAGGRGTQQLTLPIGRDEAPRDVSLTVLPVRDTDGTIVSLVHVLRDVSERK